MIYSVSDSLFIKFRKVGEGYQKEDTVDFDAFPAYLYSDGFMVYHIQTFY